MIPLLVEIADHVVQDDGAIGTAADVDSVGGALLQQAALHPVVISGDIDRGSAGRRCARAVDVGNKPRDAVTEAHFHEGTVMVQHADVCSEQIQPLKLNIVPGEINGFIANGHLDGAR